jgi:hypothetical protein
MGHSDLQFVSAVGVSATFGLTVYVLARRGRLSFRYAMGWLALSVMGVAAGLLKMLVKPLANMLGITEAAAIALGAVLVLILICVQLSISISGLQAQIRDLTEAIARVELGTSKDDSDDD